MKKELKIYDTTLRDGNQAKGLNLSLKDKLAIAKLLDEFGVHYIEGGWPNATNPLDIEFYKQTQKMTWKNAKICAFGSTRRPINKPNQDLGLLALIESQAPVITIFGKSWDLHVEHILKCSLSENLQMIEDSIAFLKSHNREIIYDAEHFFDGYKVNPDYALKTLKVAQNGGADSITLCETNGGMALSWEIEEVFIEVSKHIDIPLGIHAHNDTGTAISNSLSAVRAGATQIQGTFNGYGERCGNANLTVIIPNLQLKMGYPIVSEKKLTSLRSVSLIISEIANLADDERQPYVGETAFAHKGGAHIDGVIKVAQSFEHIHPKIIGNKREFVVSNQSGSGLVLSKVQLIEPNAQKKDLEVVEILRQIKTMEDNGYHFEVAEASFELIVKKAFNRFNQLFEALSYNVSEKFDSNQKISSMSNVQLKIGSEIKESSQKGNGPVDAIMNSLRFLLSPYFPKLKSVYIYDFKVRVLDHGKGSASKVRVWIRFKDFEKEKRKDFSWGTIGVSTNIIQASWIAILDGFHYVLNADSSQTTFS